MDHSLSHTRLFSKMLADTSDSEQPNLPAETITLKRPMNAFMIFALTRRPEMSAQNQSMRTGDISKMLSQEWKAMLPADKQVYLDQAKQLEEAFNAKYPDYIYRRRPNNTRKRRGVSEDASDDDLFGQGDNHPTSNSDQSDASLRDIAEPSSYARPSLPNSLPIDDRLTFPRGDDENKKAHGHKVESSDTQDTGGCWTCRLRRKKCDETRTAGSCSTCIRLGIDCLGPKKPEWMKAVTTYKEGIKSQLVKAGLIGRSPQQRAGSLGEHRISCFCRALYDYEAQDIGSLSFGKHAVIEVLTEEASGWWDGMLGSRRGWFPSNYVKVISDEEAAAFLAGAQRQTSSINYTDQNSVLQSFFTSLTRTAAQKQERPVEPMHEKLQSPEVRSDLQRYYENTITGESDVSLVHDGPYNPFDTDSNSEDAEVGTFVIYPSDNDTPLENGSSLTTEDVTAIQTTLGVGGCVISVHEPSQAALWIEEHWDDPLLASIQNSGYGGPFAMMLFPTTPGLAIFGPYQHAFVVDAAESLAKSSGFPVVVRPAGDNPVKALLWV
ncbi:hypothetical protein C8R43DRAFT_161492 [Mycena crocata]|nr:hypothetical protein C8R43DRAFT_161492 [Mycena crocata]